MKGLIIALLDWLWLIRLIIEILKLISQLPEDELRMIANLRSVVDFADPPGANSQTKKT